MAFPTGQFVVVYWRDHSSSGEWVEDEDIAEEKGHLCRSPGYLVRQDAVMTVVASSAHEDDGKGSTQAIITSCVEYIAEASEGTKRVRVKRK